jgi:HD-GYP domain-containing protein (c-di-GMP phosphodiesterase class II)
MTQTGVERPRYLAIVVCDEDTAPQADSLATQLGLSLWLLGLPSDIALDEVAQVIVDINMRNPASVAALRQLLAKLPSALPRRFIVENGIATHVTRVQANALGATHHVIRHKAAAELRRGLSSMADLVAPIPPARRALIAAAPGGKSVLSAGRSIAALFEGLVGDHTLQTETISRATAEVLADVTAVGGEKWLNTVREHHESTFQHCLLVTGVAATYATRNGLTSQLATALVNAALVHDVGKANVPRQILDKPGKLTDSEFAVIRRHPRAGYDYLKSHAGLPESVLDAVLHHHEALDGSGYPDSLAGKQVAPLTRILTVCDIFAAIVEARSYKSAQPPSSAIMSLVDMALRSRVDYEAVRRLASAFNIALPDTLEELAASLAPRTRARA